MKNIFHVLGLSVVLLLFLSSCEDFLDLAPVSEYNSANFYQSQKDFELAMNGAYAELQALSDNRIPLNLEARSDNVQTNQGYDPGELSRFLDNASTPSVEDIWEGFWRVIDRSNAIIGNIEGVTFEDEEMKTHLTGEAYFLRGYSYFQLGWLYGGMPIIDHPMSVAEIKQTARTTQQQTLDFALTDLQKAAELLPEEWAGKYTGKATRFAAKGIMARVHLFQQNPAAAKPLLEEIINSGKYEMFDNYADCFVDKFDNGKEHVFQIQYNSGGVGEGNELVFTSAPQNIRSDLFPQGGRSIALRVSNNLYETYEPGDIRRDFNIQKGFVDNTGSVDTVSLFFIKYAHGSIPADNTDYEVNVPVLRYTDVLLMYAEILNKEGYLPDGEAFNILNSVRARAGLGALTSLELPDQVSFENELMQERRLEFAYEYLRWFDLLRTGKAFNTMNAFLDLPEEGGGRYTMEEYQRIFAIPNDELNVNLNREVMYQNPGY